MALASPGVGVGTCPRRPSRGRGLHARRTCMRLKPRLPSSHARMVAISLVVSASAKLRAEGCVCSLPSAFSSSACSSPEGALHEPSADAAAPAARAAAAASSSSSRLAMVRVRILAMVRERRTVGC